MNLLSLVFSYKTKLSNGYIQYQFFYISVHSPISVRFLSSFGALYLFRTSPSVFVEYHFG
jgi:hypothetical protein